MEYSTQLYKIAKCLRHLFKDGGELHGFDDWDTLIGCVASIESVAASLAVETAEEESNG